MRRKRSSVNHRRRIRLEQEVGNVFTSVGGNFVVAGGQYSWPAYQIVAVGGKKMDEVAIEPLFR